MQDPAEKVIAMQFIVQPLIHIRLLSSIQLTHKSPQVMVMGDTILILIPLWIKASILPVGIQSYFNVQSYGKLLCDY